MLNRFLIIVILTLTVVSVRSQTKIPEEVIKKTIRQGGKSLLKQYAKDGWKLDNLSDRYPSRLQYLLLIHYNKMDITDDLYEIIGTCQSCLEDSIGFQITWDDACKTYAHNATNHILKRLSGYNKNTNDDVPKEIYVFLNAYENYLKEEIKRELHVSYTLYRNIGNEEKSVQTYFTIREKWAIDARLRAYNKVLENCHLATAYSGSIHDSVLENFVESK